MTKIIDWFKSDKRRIGACVIWFLIILYATFCVFFSVNKAYASDIVVEGHDNTERTVTLNNGETFTIYNDDLHNDKEYCVILDRGDQGYAFIYSKLPLKYDSVNRQFYLAFPMETGQSICYHYVWDNYSCRIHDYSPVGFGGEIIWSNYDVLDTYSGELFFQPTPTTQVLTGTRLSGEKIAKITLREIGGMVAVCLALLIGFLAFRKGWKFLVNNLRQA